MSKAKPVYGPIPVRAFADPELDGADFRVLGIIAAHDRLNANGSGCYASHATLCKKIGVHYVTFSRSTTKLGRRGYLTAAPHPLNGRLRVYRVVYTEADRAAMTARGDVNPQAKDGPGIVSLENEQAVENAKENSVNIFCEADNTFSEGVLIHTPEGARSGERAVMRGAMNGEGEEFLSDDARLAIIERRLREMKANPKPEHVLLLEQDENWLHAIVEQYAGHTGDPTGGKAMRLIDEIGWIMELHQ